jgi:hypothetical protein
MTHLKKAVEVTGVRAEKKLAKRLKIPLIGPSLLNRKRKRVALAEIQPQLLRPLPQVLLEVGVEMIGRLPQKKGRKAKRNKGMHFVLFLVMFDVWLYLSEYLLCRNVSLHYIIQG